MPATAPHICHFKRAELAHATVGAQLNPMSTAGSAYQVIILGPSKAAMSAPTNEKERQRVKSLEKLEFFIRNDLQNLAK